MEPKVISEILGHSTINITLDYYQHVSISEKQKALNKVNSSSFRIS